MQESIRTLRGTFDCRQEGDLWIIEAGFENKPELKKVYKFTPGVPFEDIDIFGRKFKVGFHYLLGCCENRGLKLL